MCEISKGKMNLEKTVLGRFGIEPLKMVIGLNRTYESERDFLDSNPEEGPGFGDFVAGNSCGMAHNSFESVGGDSEHVAKLLQPPLANTHHCPTGCPKVPAGAFSCHGPKDVKTCAAAAAADDRRSRCGARCCCCTPKGAATMMLQCAAALQGTSTAASSDGSRARQDPYIGGYAKVPSSSPGRRKGHEKGRRHST